MITYRRAIAVLIAGFTLDAVTTFVGLSGTGYVEKNPIARQLFAAHGLLFGIVSLSVFAFFLLLGIAEAGRRFDWNGTRTGAVYSLVIVGCMKILIAGWNASLIVS